MMLINIEGVELNVDDIEKWILMKKPPRYSFLDLQCRTLITDNK